MIPDQIVSSVLNSRRTIIVLSKVKSAFPAQMLPGGLFIGFFTQKTPLKVYSSHLNWGARLYSFDLQLNYRCPASLKKFF